MARYTLNRHIDFGIAVSGLPLSKSYEAALYSKMSGKRFRTIGELVGDKHRFVWQRLITQAIPEGNYTLELYADDQSLMGYVTDFVYARKSNFDGND